MKSVVEMGKVSCGDYGCGAVTVDHIPGKGVRCRDFNGKFTECPSGVAGFGTFASRGQSWVDAEHPDHLIASTPNVRWGGKPGRPRTWHEVTRAGYDSLRNRFGRRARIEYHSPMRSRARKVAGFGMGQGFTAEAMDFMPLMISPGQLAIGNITGSFLPAVVNGVGTRLGWTERSKGFAQFLVGVGGAAGFLFMRRNSYVLGASLALMPGFVASLTSFVGSMFARRNGGAAQPAPANGNGNETSTGRFGRMGQLLPEEKRRLNEAVKRAFGTTIKGGRMGQLEATGYETIVPGDYEALADSAVAVAGGYGGSAMGQPIGVGPKFRAIGQ